MPRLAIYAFDRAAVTALVFSLYRPRHRRRDTGPASTILAGLRRGQRTTGAAEREVAYYFSAFALGILGPFGQAELVGVRQ